MAVKKQPVSRFRDLSRLGSHQFSADGSFFGRLDPVVWYRVYDATEHSGETVLKPLTIKQVADQAGVGIETIRFYERERMIESPPRTESGYRQYPEEVVARIRFIKKGQSLGFSLGEIRELLSLRIAPNTTAADIRVRAQKKMQEIDEKIQALTHMKHALAKVTEQCHGHGPVSECPILEALQEGE